MDILLGPLFFIAGIVLLSSPFLIINGIFLILFKKEKKEIGIKNLTHGIIALIIGLGTCGLAFVV